MGTTTVNFGDQDINVTIDGLSGSALETATAAALQNQVDQLDASLLDLTNTLSVTGATALTITDLNRLIIAGGSTSYTINLPAATLAGSALKLEIARTATGLVTVQAASGSGKLVNGLSGLDMIAGESALIVYDGTNWRCMDWNRVPILAEMLNTGVSALSLTTGAFTDVPLAVNGANLMFTNLSALWNVTGGYFTAPRSGIYNVELSIWVAHSTGPGQYDIGVYGSSTGGGAPGNFAFRRRDVGTESFYTLDCNYTLGVAKGNKIYPSIRPLSPLTAATVVSGATLNSRATITELFRA